MSRIHFWGGLTTALMGAGLAIPVVASWWERGRWTGLGIGILVAAVGLVAGGLIALTGGQAGSRRNAQRGLLLSRRTVSS